ncbi:MAG: hypothetical protein JWM85_2614 [Acidimicrobiaceae bacterium]|nr:hypothetical protein [Acidimicrobiaceae bacterium]
MVHPKMGHALSETGSCPPKLTVGTDHAEGMPSTRLRCRVRSGVPRLCNPASLLRTSTHSGELRKERVAALSKSLGEAVSLIASIEDEVTSGERTLASLEGKIVENQGRAELSKEQSESVRSLMEEQLRRERRPAIAMHLIFGLVFFGAGIVVSAAWHL